MTTDETGPAIALTAPRDLSGTPGHDKLRRYWEVPPGGLNPRRPTATPKGGDITSNLIRSYNARSAAIYEANHAAAVAAHDDYLAGMSWTALERKHGLSDTALRDHWRKENLPYQTGRRKVER